MMHRIATAVVAMLAASLAGTAAVPAVAGATPAGIQETVVQGGLNAPRHLVLTQAGLVVTEAGTGGPAGPSNCATGPATEGAGTSQYCTGPTGDIVTISSPGRTVPVLSKLPSVIEEAIQEVTGPSAIAYGHGREAVTIDDFLVNKDGSNNLLPKPFASAFGTLRLISGGKTRVVDIAAFAAAHPQPPSSLGTVPGETPWDSDPYDVVAYRGGWAVADAGANDLLYVSATGRVSILARFPAVAEQVPAGVLGNPTPITVEAQAVPTSVAIGPDRALYVSLLRGVPSDPGTAYIYRVVPGQQPVIWARGLTTVTAIAFDRQGRLLATEFNTGGLLSPPTVPGALVRISDNGQTVTTLPVPGLFQPTGLAVSADGTVYVSNYGDSTTASSQPGEIVKITGLP
ncbi:MAG TPA: ScyD/ScyE family protein [Streptosporangiaceae bacterium]|nr:ScyD/ScyE family protein [Streptosporangiaceae bacterium]